MRAVEHARLFYDRQRPARYFFFGVLFFLLYQTSRMLAAFYLPLLGAAMLSMAVYPLHRRLVKRWPSRPSAAAAVTASAALFVVVFPLSALAWVFIHEAPSIAPAARQWLAGIQDWRFGLETSTRAAAPWLSAWRIDPKEILLGDLEALGTHVAGWAAALVRDLLTTLADLAALAISLFFFLRDGPAGLRALFELVPLAPEHKETLRARVADTTIGVMHGIIGVATVQGLLAGIGLALFGVPFPVLLGALSAFAAPVPLIGVGLVLTPVVVCLYLSGAVAQAWKVALWSFVVVGGADHVVRPLLISSRARIPFWLLFLGVLGGLRLYGFAGLLIGPVLVTVALSLATIYQREYAPVMGAGRSPGDRA